MPNHCLDHNQKHSQVHILNSYKKAVSWTTAKVGFFNKLLILEQLLENCIERIEQLIQFRIFLLFGGSLSNYSAFTITRNHIDHRSYFSSRWEESFNRIANLSTSGSF
jgi:hypothetical protein